MGIRDRHAVRVTASEVALAACRNLANATEGRRPNDTPFPIAVLLARAALELEQIEKEASASDKSAL